MKHFSAFIVLLFLIILDVTAQSVKGRIVDASGQPIEYITVSLLSIPDSNNVASTTTKSDGTYLLVKPTGMDKSLLRISGLGYTPKFVQPLDSMPNVVLSDETYNVDEVVVQAKRPLSETKDGKIIFNVENTILGKYASGIKALGQLPFIELAGNGISIKGKGAPLVYIDNKRIYDDSELSKLAADKIKSVELILAPGPEYPLDTKAVVRIKTIRNALGLSVDLATNEYWQSRFSHQQDLNLNYRLHNWDFFASVGYSEFKNKERNEISYTTPTICPIYTTEEYSERKSIDVKSGINYSDDKTHSFGVSYSFKRYPHRNASEFSSVSVQNIDEDYRNNTDILYGGQSSVHHVNAYYNVQVNKKLDMMVNADYLRGLSKSNSLTKETRIEDISSNTDGDYSLYTGLIEMNNSVLGGTLNVGTEITYTENNEDYIMHNADIAQYYPSSHNRSSQLLASLYASHRLSIKNFTLLFGGRFEYTDYQYYVNGMKNEDASEHHGRFSPFVSLSYNKGVAVSLAYANGIVRPGYGSLTNTTVYRDAYTASQGNPFLKPSYYNALQAIFSWKNLYANASYILYENDITSMCYVNNQGAIVSTVDNMPNFGRFSLDVVYSPKIAWWSPSVSAGVSAQHLRYCEQNLNTPFFTYGLDNTFELGKQVQLSISCYGQTKGDRGNISFRPNFVTDASLSTQLLKNKLHVDLSFNDIFHAEKSWYVSTSQFVRKQYKNFRDRHGFTITATYSFNSVRSKYKGGLQSSESQRL